jgi:acetylornithine deacetylase/succinyl-diaminopimelate desuccinylase-like protein
MAIDPHREIVPLLQQLIRNACVNDGSEQSGAESRNADLLQDLLEGPGLDLERHSCVDGRANLVARIAGTDPKAPSLCLLGHTDVVPVNENGWRRDPFGGELVDGEVWGRGAIDMLNLTATMALSMRSLADSGFRPTGDLIFAAVADEEAGATYGARYLLNQHPDLVRSDYLITESGGIPFERPDGIALPVLVAERGVMWPRLTVRGAPAHGSLPYATDNALIKAAEVIRRIAAWQGPITVGEEWASFVGGLGLPDEAVAALTTPESIDAVLPMLGGMGKLAFSSTRTTITPTAVESEPMANVIPDEVRIRLDVRTMSGVGEAEVLDILGGILGDLADDVEIVLGDSIPATSSPKDTPLWDTLERVGRRFFPGADLLPMLMIGGTDARVFRPGGTVAYGFGIYSGRLGMDEMATMGHGDNERIDVESLAMEVDLWPALVSDFLAAS